MIVVRQGNRHEFLDEGKTKYYFDIHDGTTLSGSVDVETTFRNSGLNKLMLLAALRANPAIRILSQHLLDTNGAAFIVAVASEETDRARLRKLTERYEQDERARSSTNALFIDEWMGLKGRGAVQKYRNRLISAYTQFTPAGRISRSVGFRRIHFMQINLYTDGITIDVNVGRGEPVASTPPRIIVRDFRTLPPAGPKIKIRELFPDGGFRLLPTAPELSPE